MNRRHFLVGMGAMIGLPGALSVPAVESVAIEVGLKNRTVRYRFSVTNESDRALESAGVDVCAPVQVCASQQCLAVSPQKNARIVVDAIGNQTVLFSIAQMVPRATAVVKVHAEVSVGRIPKPEAGDLERFKRADQWIASGHPDIVQAARKLEQGVRSDWPRRFCQWTAGHLRRPGQHVRASLGAVCALQTGKGDCTEAAVLFVALCRAAGIPARVCEGFLLREDAVLDASRYHNWAEFFDGTTWCLADPSMDRFCEKEGQYLVTRLWSDEMKHTGLAYSDSSVLNVRLLD
jgi:hypothetical protein